ncbi:MAG: DUF2973 domain-containing protein [Aphanocapsa feldmannii 277cV]|uniref:DUF2973 domain-containing protein n=2 Tax=Aphanocapsa feldmannii TaxID=192050 RepID=A0A524RRB5_9CHRO|nr:MAG: DUF2973 domain-containing protein [Aphanocapsa feldmannii 288cV]TGG96875.1 MAG: DUF2973 domain-containing protein [Aphanocapsa feldmannii 277cV]TGH19545.1 MAG: DUF2973 domain-containing protein [Aphanocapsa feldmannii 277cI]
MSVSPIAAPFSQIVPLLYGGCFVLLLIQAFRVMGKGYGALRRDDSRQPPGPTVHPELLDDQGNITDEELLTVRFSGREPLTDEDGSQH